MSGFSVQEILSWTGGRVANADQLPSGVLEQTRFSKVSVLKESRAGDVAFFFSRSFQNELPFTQASVLVTGEDFVKPLAAAGLPLWKKTVVVACSDPYLAMALVTQRIASGISTVTHAPGERRGMEISIHPSAVVDPAAKIGDGAKIGPHCVVEAGAVVGARSVLYPGCYVGVGAKLGEDCVLFPNVTIYETVTVGARVRLHSGVVLGADGFGYAPRRENGAVVAHEKIHHFGSVVIGDDVEIGANTCVDRGTFGNTIIERMAKVDNHVQIGHNCHLHEGAVVCGAAGLAGSSSVGRFAYVGGLTGVANQVHIGDGASIGACSLIAKDVPPGETMLGNPQRSYREHFRVQAKLNKLVAEGRAARKGSGGNADQG